MEDELTPTDQDVVDDETYEEEPVADEQSDYDEEPVEEEDVDTDEVAEEPSDDSAEVVHVTPAQREEILERMSDTGITAEERARLEESLDGATTGEWLDTLLVLMNRIASGAAKNEIASRELHTAHLRRCGVTDQFMDEFGPELKAAAANLPPELRGTEQGARLARAMAIEGRIASGADPEEVYTLASRVSRRKPAAVRQGPPVKRPGAPVPGGTRRTAGAGGSGNKNDYAAYLAKSLGKPLDEARVMAREINRR